MKDDSHKNAPRGIRNNNPGNVRANPCVLWLGQHGIDPDGFLVFRTPIYGIRCMAKVIRHYRDYNDLKTVAGIIKRWAPPSENATTEYINDVCERMHTQPHYLIDWQSQSIPLLRAIIWHENGEQPYSTDLFLRALLLSHHE